MASDMEGRWASLFVLAVNAVAPLTRLGGSACNLRRPPLSKPVIPMTPTIIPDRIAHVKARFVALSAPVRRARTRGHRAHLPAGGPCFGAAGRSAGRRDS